MTRPVAIYGIDVGNTRIKVTEISESTVSSSSVADARASAKDAFACASRLGQQRSYARKPSTASAPGIAQPLVDRQGHQSHQNQDEHPDASLVSELVAQLKTPARIHVVSVDPQIDLLLRATFSELTVEIRFWKAHNLPLAHPYADSEEHQLGADRLLAAWAALQLTGKPVVVVDAGTALTVDLVDRVDNVWQFLGGAIAPGLQLSAQALAQAGAMLSDTRPQPPLEYPGQSRKQCMDAGLLACFFGGADRLLDEALCLAPDAALVVTGGDGALLSSEWAQRYPELIHFPQLLELGLAGLDRWAGGDAK